jgi:hypothetical protein
MLARARTLSGPHFWEKTCTGGADARRGKPAVFPAFFPVCPASSSASGLLCAGVHTSIHGQELRKFASFPGEAIESVIPFGSRSLGVLNDNNFPFSNGRVPGNPDPNEFIIIRLDRPLRQFATPQK